MTPSELKYLYQSRNPDGHFFDRSTMKFFGDTMKNFGVYSAGNYWVLYRKSPTAKGAPRTSWRFSLNGKLIGTVTTLSEVIAATVVKSAPF